MMANDTNMAAIAGNDPKTVYAHTVTVPRVQTLLSDDELAERNLPAYVPANSPIFRNVFGSKNARHNNMPVMLTVARHRGIEFDDFSEEPLPALLPNACFDRRVAELREIAQDEELTLSETSLDHAEQFLCDLRKASLPSVFLVGNGNIRLVWDCNGERVGLQFLEDGRVQFVFLQKLNGQTSPLMGIHPASHILHLIDQNGLRPIMIS